MTEPTPELDSRFGEPDAVPTPWTDTEAAISAAELFWISTVRTDGRPHVTPLPAVWHDRKLYFCTGPAEQKAVNLSTNAQCALTTGRNHWKHGLDVVVEGTAARVSSDGQLFVLARLWFEKYAGDWDFKVVDGAFHHDGGVAHVFEVAPTKILAFAKGDFAQTRYRFS